MPCLLNVEHYCCSYLFYGLGAHQLNRKSNKELAAQMMAVQMMAAQMIVAATDRSNVVRDNNLLEKLPIHLMAIGARWRSMPLVVLANGV